MKLIDSIKNISNKYDYFLIDINGIILNFDEQSGREILFNHIPSTLEFLNKNNKTIIFLSNLKYNARETRNLLIKKGLSEKYLSNIFTSGESLLCYIKSNGKNWKNLKYKCITPEESLDLLNNDTDFKIDENIDNVDFIVSRGFEIKNDKKDFYTKRYNEALLSNKPILFINPDKTSKLGLDTFSLNQLNKSDNVIGFGKPYRAIYEQIFNIYNIKDKSKVLAVGDKLLTDVIGAKNNGIDCLFVTNGEFKDEINNHNLNDLLSGVEILSKKFCIDTPKYVIENFTI